MIGSTARSQIEAAIEAALSYIPADHESWVKIGIAVKDGMGEAGFPVWDRWSRRAANYSEAMAKPAWRSFECDGRITVDTLFHEARKYGFTFPQDERSTFPSFSRDAGRNEDGAAACAGTVAELVWQAAGPAPHDHPYLVKKGIAPYDLRMDSNGNLLVPLSMGGHLQNLQLIAKDGTKRFLPHGRKPGCHFWIGHATDIPAFCICEGYATGASLYEATGLPVAVAFDAGNLESVARALRREYPAARIIVCADNDAHDDGTPNIGVCAATTAAKSIDGVVAVPEMDGQKCDYNDLHQGRCREAVADSIIKVYPSLWEDPLPGDGDRIAQNVNEPWPEPVPLVATMGAEPYPLDALPDMIRKAVEEVQGFTKAPIPMVASCALAALSLSAQALIDVSRADTLTGPTGLYFLTIADSGERKSTCDRRFSSAIKEYDRRQREKAKPELKRYESELKEWNALMEGVLTAIKQAGIKGASLDDLRRRRTDLEKREPVPVRVPNLMRGDDTPENLRYVLAQEWPSAGVLTAEAGTVLGSHGMGKDSLMRNLALLNSLWDGETHAVGRRTSASFSATTARLTLGLQVQEATLRAFFARTDGLARGTGFLARFLFAWPESTQGGRLHSEAPGKWPFLDTFNERLAEILNLPAPFDETGSLSPMLLSLTPEAKAAWVKFHDSIEVKLGAGGELQDVRDVASKIADNAVRLAALFHMMCSNCSSSSIEFDHIVSGCRVAAWHLNEARRFLGELAMPAELSGVARLDAWLIDQCRRQNKERMPTRFVLQRGPNCLRQRKTLNAALDELVDHGRVHVIREGKGEFIHVNPRLLSGDDQ